MAVELEVIHETRYSYTAPVSMAHHLAHLRPLVDVHQELLEHQLVVEPECGAIEVGSDTHGNTCSWFSLALPHGHLAVRSSSRVRLLSRFGDLVEGQSPAWDRLAASLRYVARAPFDPAVEYAMPSPYIPRLDALLDYARPSFPAARPVAAGAIELMHRVYNDFDYASESTEVDTPLAQSFAQRSGVCQDFAHLMAGALRMLGVPARYVSGYLLTRPPGGAVDLVGADASHAWVQVYCPGTPGVPADGWLDLDPTNDLIPDTGHVRLAVGRDYGDVTPLRGVIRGGGHHTLAVAVTTRVLESGNGSGPLGPVVATDDHEEISRS